MSVNQKIYKKAMAIAIATTMTVGLCPTAAFALAEEESDIAVEAVSEETDAADEVVEEETDDALLEAVELTEDEVTEDDVVIEEDGETEDVYVLMNIPYADFYKADLNNDIPVDAFTSATLNKTRTSTLAGGSYHVDPNGTDITGVTFPVKVGEGVDLSQYTQITDDSSVEITVTNQGRTSTTTYAGSDALFESASYSYYILSQAPNFYKELTVAEDGSLVFGSIVGDVVTEEDIDATLVTESSYGDYQITLDDINFSTSKVYGVILSTEDGASYGLRHMENIWRGFELSWSSGFVKAVHNCPTSWEHYVGLMGSTITKITYYTDDGIHEIPVNLYVPTKFEYKLAVEDAVRTAGETAITLEGLPEDYAAQYSVGGLSDVSVADGKLIYSKDAAKGKYTLTISDANGKYADLTTQFTLYNEKTVVAYDAMAKSLTAADDASEAEFADYLSSITSVSVNGRAYAVSGRGAVTLIDQETGAIVQDAAPFAEGGSYEISVTATGYQAVTFTYSEDTYVLMNIPYADFYKADVNNDVPVDAFTSATLNKTRTSTLAGGSYHVDPNGTDITGVTFPVKLSEGVDLSSYTRITDKNSVDISVTNRGQTTTTTYAGADALFESASYSYYVLSEEPSYYKEVSVAEDDSLSFGKVNGTTVVEDDIDATLVTESSYGDYQITLDGISFNTDKVYGVILSTEDGASYGLRHMENIWRGFELSWSSGFVKSVHNCPTSWEHYVGLMGSTINKITYYTQDGIHEIPVNLYVPTKFEYTLAVEDAVNTAGETAITLEGLPEDYAAQYSVGGLSDVSVADGKLTYSKDAAKGRYSLTISDANGKYADITTQFTLYTEKTVAAYDKATKSLKAADGAAEAEFTDYLNSITSVSVNGTAYAASGRGAVTIINKESGAIVTDAAPIAEEGNYEISVTATGYLPVAFTYSTYEEITVEKASITKAVSASYQSNKITWKAMDDVDGYELYVKAGSEKRTLVKSFSAKKTSYTHSKLQTGTKYTYYVRAYKKDANGDKVYGAYSAGKAATPTLDKAKVSSVTAASSKKVTVKWNKVSGASGYTVYYKTSKNGSWKSVKTVKSSAKSYSYTNKKFKKGQTVYYSVRAYRTVNGKKVYSDYSAAKTVKIK